MPMQAPFAARINQAVNDQGDQHIEPMSAFAAGGQTLAPELGKFEKIPKSEGHPARAPLPRALDAKMVQVDRYGRHFLRLQFAFGG